MALSQPLSAQAPPANDNFSSAIALSGTTGTTNGSNVASTRETGEPDYGNARSVWWRWTAPSSGSAVFDTIGSDFDTYLAVFTGGGLSALTVVTSNDDSGGAGTSQVTFQASAGTSYYLQVSGFGSQTGSIRLNWRFSGAPANDNFSNAITLSGNSGTTTGSNVAATSEAGEPTFGNSSSVWWRWTAPGSGTVVFDTIGSSFDAEMAIYTGNTVNALTVVARDSDSGGSGFASRISFAAVSGTVYRIAVTGFSSATGAIQLNWQFTGASTNDNFSNATALSGASGSTAGTNIAATRETGEPEVGGASSVWFRWQAPASGSTTFDTQGSDFDTYLAVFTGSSLTTLTTVVTNDDISGGNTSSVTFEAVRGITYYIAVSGFSDRTGAIRLNWRSTGTTTPGTTTTSFTWETWRQRAAENNNVPSRGTNNWVPSSGTLSFSEVGNGTYIEDFIESTEAFAVEGIRIEWEMRATIGTSLGYVGPYVLLTQSSGTGWNSTSIGAQVFYRWESGGTNGAVLHAGRIGNPVITSNPVVPGINDNTFARHVVTVSNGVVTWSVNGQTLSTSDMGAAPYSPMRLMIGARLYDSGVRQSIEIRSLSVTTQQSLLPNDNFSGAITISGTTGSTSGSNVGATRETGEPEVGGDNTVWWKWTAPSSGTVTIDTVGSDYDTYLAVYTGNEVSRLTTMMNNDDSGGGLTSQVSFGVVSGVTYYISVAGFSGSSTGTIRLNWQLSTSTTTTTTSFTWESWRQRAAENNNAPYRGANNWVTGSGTLSFSEVGNNSYIEDFIESTQTFPVEGIRIEWEMRATIGTTRGYVGPYVLLTQSSGTGWNSPTIGAQVFYRWESGGTDGAVLHAGRIGNPVITSNPQVPGINDNTFARHVVTVSNGVITWTVNDHTMSSADMGTTPYSPMRLMVGARLYDGGVSQSIEIRGLTVTAQTAGGSPGAVFAISNRGGSSMRTDGAGTLVQGYTRIQPTSGSTTPSGVAIFGLRQNNVLVSEAGVPASPLIQNGRIYAEVSANAYLNTGIAVANPNNHDAVIAFEIRDTAGLVVRSGAFTLAANRQRAAFLDAEPFLGPKPVQGTLSFNSSVAVSVIALRTFTNERSEFLMTTLPVIDTSLPASAGTQFIPHFADGGGFTTNILLVNPSDTAVSGTVQFYNQGSGSIAGTPTNVNIGGQINNTFPYTVAGRGSVKLSTAGAGSSIAQGSVRVVPSGGGSAPVPLVVFTYKPGLYTLSEAGVPAAQGSAFRMYVQASGAGGAPGSIETGFAVANTSSASGTLTMELTNLDGTTAGLPPAVTRPLPGSGQIVGFLSSFFSNLPNPFRGVLRISTTTSGISVVGIRSRYNENGGYLMTTTPPTNEAAPPTSAEMLFPHIVNGGGFTTEFIIFSGTAGQASNGNLQFFRDDGSSLPLVLD
jgi:hypothetical protein